MKITVTTDEIVAAIRGGEHKFEGIRLRLGLCPGDFRVLDRALQKARKAGLIRYERGRGWEVVEALAIDSASPEHRIAMQALGDSPAVMDTPAPPPSPATNELTHVIDALRNEAERLADVAEEYRREGLTGHVTVTYESVRAFREVADWLESRDGQWAVAQAKESA